MRYNRGMMKWDSVALVLIIPGIFLVSLPTIPPINYDFNYLIGLFQLIEKYFLRINPDIQLEKLFRKDFYIGTLVRMKCLEIQNGLLLK